jgi:hypothetical protein
MTNTPSYLDFDQQSYHWKADVDYRKHPEAYRVGKGEQGVLICEPYKGEILPYWRFKTPDIATESSQKIYSLFLAYLKQDEFVGADMARKFLQMGFTRARRYANYKGGRKYSPQDYALLTRGTGEEQKAQSAAIFYEQWQKAEAYAPYATLKKEWKAKYG